jgi:Phage integrase, N-terminal SAM-like domain
MWRKEATRVPLRPHRRAFGPAFAAATMVRDAGPVYLFALRRQQGYDDAKGAVRRNTLRAPAPLTVAEAATAWLEACGRASSATGLADPYKPSAIRAYEAALRLRILPELGRVKLAQVTRTDLQDLVDRLVASGLDASTIGVTLLPLRGIYKRAVARGEIAVNPTAAARHARRPRRTRPDRRPG